MPYTKKISVAGYVDVIGSLGGSLGPSTSAASSSGAAASARPMSRPVPVPQPPSAAPEAPNLANRFILTDSGILYMSARSRVKASAIDHTIVNTESHLDTSGTFTNQFQVSSGSLSQPQFLYLVIAAVDYNEFIQIVDTDLQGVDLTKYSAIIYLRMPTGLYGDPTRGAVPFIPVDYAPATASSDPVAVASALMNKIQSLVGEIAYRIVRKEQKAEESKERQHLEQSIAKVQLEALGGESYVPLLRYRGGLFYVPAGGTRDPLPRYSGLGPQMAQPAITEDDDDHSTVYSH